MNYLILFWLVLVLLANAGIADADDAGRNDAQLKRLRRIFKWVNKTEGGKVSKKIGVERIDEHDPNSLIIVVANEDIEKNEVLIKTPWTLMIRPKEDGWGNCYCRLVERVAEEMILGEKSVYAPHIHYLNNVHDVQLPAQFSDEAKELVLQIRDLPPYDLVNMLDSDWYEDCDADRDDTFTANVAAMVSTRYEDCKLIPGYESLNHRNDDSHNNIHYRNAEYSTNEEFHEVRAHRKIEAGEQIVISYNKCDNCEDRYYDYGTPELFRDYGFIEWYPQRWGYPEFGDSDKGENQMRTNQFYLYKNEESNDLTVEWEYLTDSNEKMFRFMHFLGCEIRRLRQLETTWTELYDLTDRQLEIVSSITPLEWKYIQAYLNANLVAMTVALNDLTQDDKAYSGGHDSNRTPYTVTHSDLEELKKENYEFLYFVNSEHARLVEEAFDLRHIRGGIYQWIQNHDAEPFRQQKDYDDEFDDNEAFQFEDSHNFLRNQKSIKKAMYSNATVGNPDPYEL